MYKGSKATHSLTCKHLTSYASHTLYTSTILQYFNTPPQYKYTHLHEHAGEDGGLPQGAVPGHDQGQ